MFKHQYILMRLAAKAHGKMCFAKLDLGSKYQLILLTKGFTMDDRRGRNFTCSQLAGGQMPC